MEAKQYSLDELSDAAYSHAYEQWLKHIGKEEPDDWRESESEIWHFLDVDSSMGFIFDEDGNSLDGFYGDRSIELYNRFCP